MTATIRPYSPTDWTRLCEIHDAARLDELRPSVSIEAFLPLEQAAESEGLFDGTVVVAEVDGVVRGFVAFTDNEMTWLYVEPSYYGRGIGKMLLQHAIDHAGPVLRTEVLEGNEPALGLYRSYGFVIVERRVGKMQGNERFPAVGFILERREVPTFQSSPGSPAEV
jgi:ribosomal protein S18 acetylase RimI-like enzyme